MEKRTREHALNVIKLLFNKEQRSVKQVLDRGRALQMLVYKTITRSFL